MRFAPRTLHRLSFLPALVLLLAAPASSQNLLVNPGFDRDLSGWTVATTSSPSGFALASAAWDPADAQASVSSGSAAFRLQVSLQQTASASLSQCVAVRPSSAYAAFGAIRIARQQNATLRLNVTFFDGAGCAGTPTNGAGAWALAPLLFEPNDSAGAWLPASAQAVSPAAARSARFELLLSGFGTFYASSASFDGAADDAFFGPSGTNTWILPSAARVSGAGGSAWTTVLTLANPGASDAVATLKFLGHDRDGREGPERTVLVRAGALIEYRDVLGTLFGVGSDYGAIRVASPSADLVVQSETSTPALGGTVGQALPAFDPTMYADANPKSLAPIRENAAFRTNLVLANPTEIPVTARVALFAADGSALATSDVDLPPLGMTQISRVAAALGASTLDSGRIEASTRTPGGVVAAYASVIDNITRDPRTLLPQGNPSVNPSGPTTTSPNLLVNPGFAPYMWGWHVQATVTGRPSAAGVGWTATDASGDSASGGLGLHAYTPSGTSLSLGYGQCVLVPARSDVSFGAKYLINRALYTATAVVVLTFFDTTDCSGVDSGSRSVSWPDPLQTPWGEVNSGGHWVTLASRAEAPAYARSASINVGISSTGPHFPGTNYIDAVADDAFLTTSSEARYLSILPSAASGRWKTDMTLVNAGASSATVLLKWLGHDVDGWLGVESSVQVHAGETLEMHAEPGGSDLYGAVLVTSSSPSAFLQSETYSLAPGGGSVGQALPAFDSSLYATDRPKSVAPIREDTDFRTNLVLANPTEIPVTAHIVLFAAEGTAIGSRDVVVPPLGMTQINRVASELGASVLDAGRLSISTPTPGGAVAAYASVIDNVTNDPRTLLPR